MAPNSSGPPSVVLLVEDEPMIAMNTQMLLSAIGIDQVHTASTVSEAFELIDREDFDFAILDISLGDESGVPVAERLCRDAVRLVITTGFEDVDLPPGCEGTPILRKPYRLKDLETILLSGV
jgi:DNA-binding response OmpR family regulator